MNRSALNTTIYNYKKFGSVYIGGIFGFKFIALLGCKANVFLLQENADAFSNKKGWEIIEPYFAGGLILQDGDEHRRTRQVMTSLFDGKSIQKYISKQTDFFNLRFSNFEDNIVKDLPAVLKHFMFDSSLNIFFGLQNEKENNYIYTKLKKIIAGTNSILRVKAPPLKHGKAIKARAKLLSFLQEKSEAHRRSMLPEENIFSHMSLAAKENVFLLSSYDVARQMIFFMMASYDTTSTVLTMLLWHLANDINLQNKILMELSTEQSSQVDIHGINIHPLTESVIHEALRMYPPVIGLPRGTTRDVVFDNFLLPAGRRVAVCPLFTHYHAEYWDQPYEFQPERFLNIDVKQMQKEGKWIPFGLGSHMCLGQYFARMQMKFFLLNILKRFELYRVSDKPVKMKWIPIPSPSKALPLKFLPKE